MKAQTQPGADMDAEVARMMGVKGRTHFAKYHEPPLPDYHTPYSTDITAAWLVIEHMRKLGFEFELKSFFDDYTAQFWNNEVFKTPTPPIHPSAPAAIAIAALAATGGEG